MFNSDTTTLADGNSFAILSGLWAGKKPPFTEAAVIRNTNFRTDGRLDLSDVAILEVETRQLLARTLQVGDIIIERSGGGPKQPVGRVCYFEASGALPYSFSNFTSTLRVTDRARFFPRFVHYFLLYLYQSGFTVSLQRATTGIRNLDFDAYLDAEMPQIPIQEQKKIAAILRKVQQAVEVEENLVAATRELKHSVMRELYARGLREAPQMDSAIGLIPEGWATVTLGDHALVISKGSSPKWQGFNYTSHGVLFVRSQNVGDGRMIWTDRAYLPAEWNAKEKRSVLKAGDVLINLVGASIGRAALGGKEIDGANCNQAVCFVRLREESLDPAFLAGFLLTEPGQRQIHTQKKDIARANLSLEDVRSLLVPLPPPEEQREVVNAVSLLDRKLDIHERRLARLQDLFNSLLTQLMSREISTATLDIDVSDPINKEYDEAR